MPNFSNTSTTGTPSNPTSGRDVLKQQLFQKPVMEKSFELNQPTYENSARLKSMNTKNVLVNKEEEQEKTYLQDHQRQIICSLKDNKTYVRIEPMDVNVNIMLFALKKFKPKIPQYEKILLLPVPEIPDRFFDLCAFNFQLHDGEVELDGDTDL